MREYKILVYNVITNYAWFIMKKFYNRNEAFDYCEKRTNKMYLVTVID